MREATNWPGRSTLEDRLDQGYPESWVPEQPGETIVGEFVRLDQGRTEYGGRT